MIPSSQLRSPGSMPEIPQVPPWRTPFKTGSLPRPSTPGGSQGSSTIPPRERACRFPPPQSFRSTNPRQACPSLRRTPLIAGMPSPMSQPKDERSVTRCRPATPPRGEMPTRPGRARHDKGPAGWYGSPEGCARATLSAAQRRALAPPNRQGSRRGAGSGKAGRGGGRWHDRLPMRRGPGSAFLFE